MSAIADAGTLTCMSLIASGVVVDSLDCPEIDALVSVRSVYTNCLVASLSCVSVCMERNFHAYLDLTIRLFKH